MTDATQTNEENIVETATDEASTKKPIFDVATATDAEGNPIPLNDENQLTAIPHNWTSEFRSLKISDFQEKALCLEWRALNFDLRAQAMAARAAELREDAVLERSGGDPVLKNRAAARKVAASLEAALAALVSEGVETDDFLAELGFSRAEG